MLFKKIRLAIVFCLVAFAFVSCEKATVEEVLQGSLWELVQVASQEFPISQGEMSIHQYIYFAKDGYVYELMMTDLKISKVLNKKDIKTAYTISENKVKIGNFEFDLIKNSTLKVPDDGVVQIVFNRTRKPSIKEVENAETIEMGLSIFQ